VVQPDKEYNRQDVGQKSAGCQALRRGVGNQKYIQIQPTFRVPFSPSRIGMYRRRIFWNYDSSAKDKSVSTKVINENNRKVKTEVLTEEIEGYKNEVEEKMIVKI
jgi:hypothetical protein